MPLRESESIVLKSYNLAEADRIVELEPGEEAHRVRDLVHAEPDPGTPVANGHLHVRDRRLHVLPQRLALGRRELRQDLGNHHVVAGEDAS